MGQVKVVAAAVLLFGAIGCSASSDDSGASDKTDRGASSSAKADAPKCAPLSADALSVMKEGLRKAQRDKIKLKSGSIAALPKSLNWPFGDRSKMYVAAVKITDGKNSEVDLFALSDVNADGGSILALGDALNWFIYGSAAEPGSPIDDYAVAVQKSDQAEAVKSCQSA
jgi:hypothetical protein